MCLKQYLQLTHGTKLAITIQTLSGSGEKLIYMEAKRKIMKNLIPFFFICLLALFSCNSSTSDPTDTLPPPEDTDSENINPDDTAQIVSGEWDAGDFTYVYDVGPGYEYEDPSEIPWEDLLPATLVRIHFRTEPYRAKWVITTHASEDAPLVVTGVAENGNLPVISGENAITRQELYYLNEVRSVVKIGNYTGDSDNERPAHVIVENLDIRSGRPDYSFTDRYGESQTYSQNAAAVHIEEGDQITIKNCILHDSGNGLFTSHLTTDILIRSNYIYDNGIEGRYYEHNTYTESFGITYEFNHFGPLRTGCGGNNLKDRSAGTIIRYNWIEGGNRQLDLVETDYESFSSDASYDRTFVYGNILFESGDDGNSQMIHYGGDGSNQDMYRRGVLYLYHNTIVSERTGNTTLIRLSTDDVTADIRNNIVYTSASAGHLALTNGQGILYLTSNWITEGYRNSFESTSADIKTSINNITGTRPGFTDANTGDFTLATGSDCISGAGNVASGASGHPVLKQYIRHQAGEDRPDYGDATDIGAFSALIQKLLQPYLFLY
ncbi:MAG: polysaccharide-degrading enzyme [Proteobacteria bacterium]|nr:polysaccharide-degrading enzyme [Pseudomonadota bacterium]